MEALLSQFVCILGSTIMYSAAPDVPMTQDTISSKNQIDDSQISTSKYAVYDTNEPSYHATVNNVALESIDKINYNKHIIDKDSGLEEFFDERGIEFCRGCAFYEFQRKVEDIHKNSIIILVDKVNYHTITFIMDNCNIIVAYG